MASVVNNINGPNLIIAGPGTGKTTFLINKTIDIIKHEDFKNSGIIICTFTRNATEELISRLYSRIEINEINRLNIIIGTIHSICFDLLAGYSEKDFGDYKILPEESQVHFIHSKLKNLGYSNDRIKKNGWTLSEELASIYNIINDNQIDYKKIDFNGDIDMEEACYTYPTYRSLLKKNRLFDFATIQSTFLRELNESTSFKKNIKYKYKYILVDEYQDINNIQNDIFINLAEPEYNLTIVGDDDQSIYGFRGSRVEHIRNFKNNIIPSDNNIKVDILNTNFRSTKRIVDFTNCLLRNLEYNKIDKGIKAKRTGLSHPVVINEFRTDEDEGNFIARSINDLINSNIISSYSQIAILFKSIKGQSDGVVSALEQSGIPYKLVGAGNFFDSLVGKEYMALLDYFLARDIDNTILFFDNLADIDVSINSDLTSLYSRENYLEQLENIFEKKNYKSCIDLTYDIFISTEFLKRHASEGPNLGKLTDIVLKFDDFSDNFNPWGLFSYLTYLINSHDVDYTDVSNNDSVNMLTIHQSKGLEFPVVFLPSQVERRKHYSIIDRFKKLANQEISDTDEDGRVLYVGCSRAEDLLIISGSNKVAKTKKIYNIKRLIKSVDQTINTTDNIDFKYLINQNFKNTHGRQHQNMVLSYNKISLYNYCPRAFMFANVWNLQTVRIGGLEYGRNIHKIVEIILKKISSNENLENICIDEVINNNWMSYNYDNNQNEKYKTTAKKQLNGFIANCSEYLEPEKIFSVEDKFNITVSGNIITGRFDAVFQDDNNYIIIDFKTGDRRDYSSQLTFYNLCFKEKYNPTKGIKLAIYYMKEGELEFINRNNESEELEKIYSVSRSIKQNIFIPKPGKICKDCSFNSICEYAI